MIHQIHAIEDPFRLADAVIVHLNIKLEEKQEILDLGVERHEILEGFAVGDTVKVIDGPLDGFTGTVEEVDMSKSRVRVIVSMFGRETPVDLDYNQVEYVSE